MTSLATLSCALLMVISGCGVKGDLYLPEEQNQSPQSTTSQPEQEQS